MKQYLNSIIIAVAIILTALILGNAFKSRNKNGNSVSVTGMSSKDFVADLIIWNGSFTKKNMDLKTAYSELNTDREAIKKYFLSKGVNEKDIIFPAVNIDKEYTDTYDKEGNRVTGNFTGYKLTQYVQIESNEVDKIENLSREVSELINTGVEFYSSAPQYLYTKLAELKLEMIAEATNDAKMRAEKIAKSSGASLGGLKTANMGVFQIVAKNSTEDYSWGGAFNTSSKRKTASITMKLQYGVR